MNRRQYKSRHLIPMFIGTPCMRLLLKVFMRHRQLIYSGTHNDRTIEQEDDC